MLKKVWRINKDKEIKEILKRGRAAYSPLLMVKFLPNRLGYARFGLIVSNKVSKKATLRNLIKRRVRAQIGIQLPTFRQALDSVILVSPKITSQDNKVATTVEIKQALDSVFKSAGLL